MKCPNCGAKMEGEVCPTIEETVVTDKGVEATKTPGAHFYCHGCDSEWVWYRSKRELRQIDGATSTDPIADSIEASESEPEDK